MSREAGFRVRQKRLRCISSLGQGLAAAMLALSATNPSPRGRQRRTAAMEAFVVARKRKRL